MRSQDQIKRDKRLMFKNSYPDKIQLSLGAVMYDGYITLSNGRKGTFVMGRDEKGMEHVSIRLYKKLPTWEEMCEVKDIFWNEEETVVQLHPKKSAYVNICEALHLWRPVNPEDWNRIESCQNL